MNMKKSCGNNFVGNALATLRFGFALACLLSCSGDDSKGPDSDTNRDTDSDTDTGLDTDTETDTGEDENPPDLKDLCETVVIQTPVSEQNDIVDGDEGNGQYPAIGHNGSTIMAWSYFARGKGNLWETQVTMYDVEKGGIPGPDGGPPAPGTEPAERGPVSQMTSIAPKDNEFGLVWLDGRWDKSKECTEKTFNDCKKEIAFMRLDVSGKPINSAVPVRVSTDSVIKAMPNIAATATGYVVVWTNLTDSNTEILCASLDEKGTPGAVLNISGDEGIAASSQLAIAALGKTVAVAWISENQKKLLARILDDSGKPTGDILTLDENLQVINPALVADDDAFLISWSRKVYSDCEVYTMKLSLKGEPASKKNRATWTVSDVFSSALAWNGSNYALAWLSAYPSGSKECTEKSCTPQVYGTILDEQGVIKSVPVLLSNDPNSCMNLSISSDGSGWTSVWELSRGSRHQIFYGRMVCK